MESKRDQDLATQLDAAKSGDPDALNYLVNEFYDFVRSVAENEMPSEVLQKTGASEIAQEAFLQLANEVRSVRARTRGEFAQWLKLVATHKSLDAIRRYRAAKRNIGREQVIDRVAPGGNPSREESPSVVFEKNEAGEQVTTSMQKLPPLQKQILRSYFYEELSLAEISRRLDLPPHTVAKHLRDGMKEIERQLPFSFRIDGTEAP